MTTIQTPAAATATPTIGRAAVRTSWVLTALPMLFLLADSVVKLIQLDAVIAATVQLGFPASSVVPIGAVLMACLVLYLVPRTAVLGAVLLTGYLGGAVCAQLRVEAPLFSTVLFPVYMGVLIWVALYLRSPALRTLVRSSLS